MCRELLSAAAHVSWIPWTRVLGGGVYEAYVGLPFGQNAWARWPSLFPFYSIVSITSPAVMGLSSREDSAQA